MNNDERPSTVPEGGADGPPTAPHADGPPTFASAAESLLKHLRFGAARAPAPPPPAGTFPDVPNYEIESELGRGGMGVVYGARHAALRHTVAIKMILMSEYASPNEVTRFVAEAEAVATVRHPNVVQVHDLGDCGGRPYFVMEHVAGGTLAGLIRSAGPLDPIEAAALIGAVARGAQAAHDAGIVHRDLKPANILLHVERPNGAERSVTTPKVSDFGLAKRLALDVTRSQAVLGTPAYMAPEQAGGQAKFVGPQADVFALGVVLYECLSKRLPFDAPEPWALIHKVLEDPPEPLRARAPGVPRDLELICMKCLEKEPHHRYPTAAALADDLARFGRGEPVSVRPIGAPTRVLRWAQKRPAPAALSALAVLLALVVPALAVRVQSRFNQRDAVAVEARQKEEAARKAEVGERRARAEAERAEAESRRARTEAEKARVAAERLADARELFGLENTFRTRAAARPLGWATATLAEVPRALALAGGDPQVREPLRSAAAGALIARDLVPLDPVARGFTASVLATDPTSGLVAVGQFKAWGPCRVLLVDAATGRTVRELTFPTIAVAGDRLFDLAQDGTRSLAFGPGGTRLFVGTRSSQVMRFDLNTSQNTPVASWPAAARAVEQLAVSPNGKTVYGLCRPGVPVLAWDAETGKPGPNFSPDESAPVRSFAVLPSGDLIAGTGVRLYRWKATGELVRSVPNATCFRLAPAGGSMLMLGDGPRLDVYDGETFEPTARFTDPNLRRDAHEGYIRSIVVHPSGAFIATATGDSDDRAVQVWELASGRLIGTVSSAGTGPVGVAWGGDGTHLLVTADERVARWRFAPAEAQQFACFAGPPLDAAAFVSGARCATPAALGALWSGRRELIVGAAAPVHLSERGRTGPADLTAGPAGALAVTTQSPGIVLCRADALALVPSFAKQSALAPRFSPDGRSLWAVVDSKTVRRYDPVTRAELAQWNNGIEEIVSGLASVDALAVGRTAAVSGGRNGRVHLLDPETCRPMVTFRGAGDPVLAVALTPDEALVAAGTQGGQLRVIRTADRTELPPVTAHAAGVTAVAVCRAGVLLATGGRDRAVRLWKRTGDRFEPLLTVSDLPGGVAELHFSPTDGRLLVLLASEHAVRVWDIDRLNAQLTELKLGW